MGCCGWRRILHFYSSSVSPTSITHHHPSILHCIHSLVIHRQSVSVNLLFPIPYSSFFQYLSQNHQVTLKQTPTDQPAVKFDTKKVSIQVSFYDYELQFTLQIELYLSQIDFKLLCICRCAGCGWRAVHTLRIKITHTYHTNDND